MSSLAARRHVEHSDSWLEAFIFVTTISSSLCWRSARPPAAYRSCTTGTTVLVLAAGSQVPWPRSRLLDWTPAWLGASLLAKRGNACTSAAAIDSWTRRASLKAISATVQSTLGLTPARLADKDVPEGEQRDLALSASAVCKRPGCFLSRLIVRHGRRWTDSRAAR